MESWSYFHTLSQLLNMKPPGTTKPLVTQNDLYRLLNLLTHSSPLTDPLVSVKWIHPV